MRHKILKKLAYRIAEVSSKAGEGHVPSALSILDIVWVIYNNFININLTKIDDGLKKTIEWHKLLMKKNENKY